MTMRHIKECCQMVSPPNLAAECNDTKTRTKLLYVLPVPTCAGDTCDAMVLSVTYRGGPGGGQIIAQSKRDAITVVTVATINGDVTIASLEVSTVSTYCLCSTRSPSLANQRVEKKETRQTVFGAGGGVQISCLSDCKLIDGRVSEGGTNFGALT